MKKGKIKEFYFIEKFNNITIEKTQEHYTKRGDRVFLGAGKYNKKGFMTYKIIVENGKFVKYE